MRTEPIEDVTPNTPKPEPEAKPTTGRKRERRGKAPGGDSVRHQLRGHLRAAGRGGKVQARIEPPESKEDRELRYALRAAARQQRRVAHNLVVQTGAASIQISPPLPGLEVQA